MHECSIPAITAIVVASLICVIISTISRKLKIKKKNILIIGGTSGLGLELVNILSKQNRVTVASRHILATSMESTSNIEYVELDITDISSFAAVESSFDYIFCCPGISLPAYFHDCRNSSFRDTMNINFLGVVNSLLHYYKHNKKPFSFVMIGSTSVLVPFPGYASYAPSKAALFSFYLCCKEELRKNGVDLYIYNSSSFTSRGFARENLTKPKFTVSMDNLASVTNPRDKAVRLLNQMRFRATCTSDFGTYMYQIRYECENLIDYLLFPFAVIFCAVFRWYISYRYRKYTGQLF